MGRLLSLLEGHRPHLHDTLSTCLEPPEMSSLPEPASPESGAWRSWADLLYDALRLLAHECESRRAAGPGHRGISPSAVASALSVQVVELVVQARHLGGDLSGLLRVVKCVRRECREWIDAADLNSAEALSLLHDLEAAFDRLEMALCETWDQKAQWVSAMLGDRQVLQTIHYPVLLVDVRRRVQWLNEAALALCRSTTCLVSPGRQPQVLDEFVPQLAASWGAVCDVATGRIARCRLELSLDSAAGHRWFVVSAWPVETPERGSSCVALFMLDVTQEREQRKVLEQRLREAERARHDSSDGLLSLSLH